MRNNNVNPPSYTSSNNGNNLETAFRDEGIFNSSSSTVLFTTSGGQKIYIGGDATHVGNNKIVKVYDTCGMKYWFHNGTNPDGLKRLSLSTVSKLENREIGVDSGYILGEKKSQTLSNIDIMVALHHGINNLVPYYRYLATPRGVNANSTSASMNKFDALLYPSSVVYVYNKALSSMHPLYKYSENEVQWGANDWIISNLVTNKNVYTYNAGDVVVTFSGSSNSIAQ
jgi:hypothetical protein